MRTARIDCDYRMTPYEELVFIEQQEATILITLPSPPPNHPVTIESLDGDLRQVIIHTTDGSRINEGTNLIVGGPEPVMTLHYAESERGPSRGSWWVI